MNLRLLVPLLAATLPFSGCQKSHTPDTRNKAKTSHQPEHRPRHGHKPGHRHHGDRHRPFKDINAYIAHLDRPERNRWQKPDTVVKALNLTGKETVVDVGAGSGYFTFRFARALAQGQVVAADIEPKMVQHIRKKASELNLKNVKALLWDTKGPKIPPDTDLVFVCNVFHHIDHQSVWLTKLAAQMKKGSRLALVEFFKNKKTPIGPPVRIRLTPARARKLAVRAGFTQVRLDEKLLPYQYLIIFRK